MPSIGSLIIDMQLQIAKFVSNSAEVHKTLKGMEKGFGDFKKRAVSELKGVAAGLATGFAVGAIVNTIRQQLNIADRFEEIAQSVGLTTTQLSEYSTVAKLAGLDTEEFAKAARKVANSLAGAAAGNKEAQNLFKAFGIDPGTIDNIKTLDDAILEFADKFAALPEGALRTAAAIEVFGEKGAKILPVLVQGSARIKELREVTRLFGATVGEEFAGNASRFNDALDLLGAASEGFKRRIVSAIAGPLAAAAEAFVEVKKESALAQQALGGFNGDPIERFAIQVIRALAAVIDQIVAVKRAAEILITGLGGIGATSVEFARGAQEGFKPSKLLEGIGVGDITNPAAAIGKLWGNVFKSGAEKAKPVAQEAFKQISDLRTLPGPGAEFVKKFDEQLAKAKAPKEAKVTDKALEQRIGDLLKKETGAGKAIDNSEIKKQLDGLLQEIARDLGEINKLSQERLSFLQIAFQEAFIGINDFYERKRNIQEEATRASIEAIDREIAALEKFRNNPALKPEERIDAENKIAAAQQKRADVERQASVESQRNWFEQRKALEDYRRAVEDISIQILEMEGRTAEAARRRFQQQNEQRIKQIQAEATSTANTPEQRAEAVKTQESLRRLEEQAVARAQLNELSEQAGIIQDQLRNKEELLEVARKRGTIGELALLRESDAARKDTVVRLRAIADAQLAVAEGGTDQRAIQNARNFKVEIEKLAAASDQLRDKFDQIAESAFSDFLTAAVTGTKSLKDAFKDMVNSIINQISRLAAQDIASTLFGKGSGAPGGGFGGILAGLFGGGGGASKASASVAGDFVPASGSIGGGGIGALGNTISSTFGKLGDWFGDLFRAEGGPVAANQPYIVGERGPEMIIPRASGTVIPAGAFGGGMGVTMNFAISGPIDQRTQQQIGRAAYEGIMRAQRRNG